MSIKFCVGCGAELAPGIETRTATCSACQRDLREAARRYRRYADRG